MNKIQKTVIEQIDELLKTAGLGKRSESAADQGHVENQGDSGTSHPSKNAPDLTEAATTGEHFSENTSDIKKQTPNVSVDAASEDKMEGASVNELTTASAIGEDPSVETESVKNVHFVGSQNTDGTSIKDAAARIMNEYNAFNAMIATLNLSPAPEKKAEETKPTEGAPAKKAEDAKPAAATSNTKQDASTKSATDAAQPAAKQSSADNTEADEKAGEKAAEVVAQAMAKQAEECEAIVAAVIKEAMTDAACYVDFLRGRQDGRNRPVAKATTKAASRPVAKPAAKPTKRAMENEDAGPAMTASGSEGEGDSASGGDGAGSGSAGGGEGASMGGLEAALMALGLTPEDLESIPPELLAEAIASVIGAGGGGGGEGGMPAEAMPAEMPPVDPTAVAA